MAPEIWCAVDGGSDRQMDRQKISLTEMGAHLFTLHIIILITC